MDIARLRELFLLRADGALIRRCHVGKAKAGEVAGSPHNAGYLRVRVDGAYYLAHRIVFALHYGYTPPTVDHIDGVRTNNVPSNLRAASQGQQLRNSATRCDNISGVKGLGYVANKHYWRGRVTVHGKTRTITSTSRLVVENWLISTRQELHGEYACNGR